MKKRLSKIIYYNRIRTMAMLLALSVFMCVFDMGAVFADEVLTHSNTLEGWTFETKWGNGQNDITFTSDTNELVNAKLSISYSVPLTPRQYDPGDISITIPGFGDILRNNKVIAKTPDGQSDFKWRLEYNREKDEYVFKNKETISKEQPLAGGFEILWQLNSRAGIN